MEEGKKILSKHESLVAFIVIPTSVEEEAFF